MDAKMFCFQCQETAGGKGCTVQGVCGKKPDVAEMQDLLVYVTKGLGAVTTALRAAGKKVSVETNHRITMNLFVTITNANFDREAIMDVIEESLALKAQLLRELGDASGLPAAAQWTGARADFAAKAKTVGVLATENEDVRSLRELTMYGLKGLSAYMEHANALGYENEEVDAFTQSALAKLLDDTLDGDALTALVLETGKWGVAGMALLDKANTESYGNPEISKVKLGVGSRPGILISGHDLKDLERLLEQTKGTGVDVYTHGEMIPAHYYPKFKKYDNLVGNYGNAWWQQKEE
ncbi:MAG: hydroxylamine reductase, partial [Selenomonas sp.]|nr:hydroxylamine reductase [Selenomonas sp.]